MGKVDEIRRFLGVNRHKLTPQQALHLDEKVIESWDPQHPEAPSSVDFSELTHEQQRGDYLFKDPDWVARSEGADPTTRPLYPTDKTNDVPSEPSMSEGKA